MSMMICFAGFAKDEAHTGTVRGVVKTSDNEPVSGVTIKLTGINKNTITDGSGKYFFGEVRRGTILLKRRL